MAKIPEIPSSEVTKAPGRWFERASRGETIMLTRYGRPYLVLCPPPESAQEEDQEVVEEASQAG